jgi:uncharacterized HAD superfamily protein
VKIAIDIDNVITNLTKIIEERYGKLPDGDKYTQIHKVFKNHISFEEEYDIYHNIKPMLGARDAIASLSYDHQIYIVTARSEAFRHVTEQWLLRNQIPYTALSMNLGNHEYAKKHKYQWCTLNKMNLLIDDWKKMGQMLRYTKVKFIHFIKWTQVVYDIQELIK